MKRVLIWTGLSEGTTILEVPDTDEWQKKLAAGHTQLVGYAPDDGALELDEALTAPTATQAERPIMLFSTNAEQNDPLRNPIVLTPEDCKNGVTIYFSGWVP